MFSKYAESRGLTAPRTFTAALADFRKKGDEWFDGTVEAVDQRLARCNKLLHVAHTKAAEDPASQLQVIAELSADRTALKNLRADLTSGATDRDTGYVPPRVAATLTPEERRWVTLESAKFVAEHETVRHDTAEMAERARRHAEVATSAMNRPQVLTAAFEREVATIARLTPRRTASRKGPVFTDFPDSQMFL